MTTAAPTGLLLGYARVSTQAQSLDLHRVWTEKMSGKRDDRPQLAALLAYARKGDTIVVWRPTGSAGPYPTLSEPSRS